MISGHYDTKSTDAPIVTLGNGSGRKLQLSKISDWADTGPSRGASHLRVFERTAVGYCPDLRQTYSCRQTGLVEAVPTALPAGTICIRDWTGLRAAK